MRPKMPVSFARLPYATIKKFFFFFQIQLRTSASEKYTHSKQKDFQLTVDCDAAYAILFAGTECLSEGKDNIRFFFSLDRILPHKHDAFKALLMYSLREVDVLNAFPVALNWSLWP